jgi:hypothetical protein
VIHGAVAAVRVVGRLAVRLLRPAVRQLVLHPVALRVTRDRRDVGVVGQLPRRAAAVLTRRAIAHPSDRRAHRKLPRQLGIELDAQMARMVVERGSAHPVKLTHRIQHSLGATAAAQAENVQINARQRRHLVVLTPVLSAVHEPADRGHHLGGPLVLFGRLGSDHARVCVAVE